MDRGAWWAIVHRVAKSPTQLKWHITHTERWKWSPPSSHWGRCYVVPLNIVQEAHGWPFERWPKQSDTPTGIKFILFSSLSHFLPVSLLVSHVCPVSVFRVPALIWPQPFSALTYRKLILALLDYSTLLPRQDLTFLRGFPAKDQPAPSFSLINLACDRLAAQGTTLCFIIFLIFPLSLIINGWGTHDRFLLLSFLKKMFSP